MVKYKFSWWGYKPFIKQNEHNKILSKYCIGLIQNNFLMKRGYSEALTRMSCIFCYKIQIKDSPI